MLNRLLLAVLLFALAPFAGAVHALRTADFAAERAQLEESYLPKWLELASEANTKRAFATRNRCYIAILSIDPEQGTARRGLKYRRVDGEWVRTESRTQVKDAKSNSITTLAAEVDVSITEYRDAVLALIDAHAEELGPGGVVAAYKDLLALDPESALVHELLGEVKRGERWLLIETARSIERHAALRKLAAASFAAVPKPTQATPDGFENELGIEWTAGLETERVRAFGTGEPDELEQILRAADAMHELVFAALGRRVPLAPHFTLYSLADPDDVQKLFRKLPSVRSDPGAAITTVTGGWLGIDSRFGNWSPDRPRRVDGSIRAVVSQYLKNGYRINLRHGWVSEGIGLYLVEAMVGTRLTWFASKSRYVEEGTAAEKETFSLEQTELDWMVEGRKLLSAEDAPHLGALIGRQVSSMSANDLLHAYLLATYLIEGRPDELPALLEAIGNNENPTRAFETVLGDTLPHIESRLLRWVEEVSQIEEE